MTTQPSPPPSPATAARHSLTVVGKSADIVDAQIHMGPGGIEPTIACMDAIGISAALVDEYWLTSGLRNKPNHPLRDGGFRPVCPTAELAAQLHPTRFAWLLRVHRLDPEYRAVIRMVRDAPAGRALRIDPGMSRGEMRFWTQGGYDHILAIAADWDLPVFVFAPDLPEGFHRAARAFPTLKIGIDHCGLFTTSMRAAIGGGTHPRNETEQLALFDRIRALSEQPNLSLKWGHASAMFDRPAYPGEALWPILRSAIDAYGADRVFWESDYSVNQRGESWADLLFGVRNCPLLDDHERTEVLGAGLRRWLDWPRG